MRRTQYFRVSLLQCLLIVQASVSAGTVHAKPTSPVDFIQPPLTAINGKQKLGGSVQVQALVPSRTSATSYNKNFNISKWIDAGKVKAALENFITQNGVFSQVVQESPDYVLDIWIEDIQTRLEITGEGYIYDLASIWRLTRTRDGAVTFCDFIKGHGAARAFGSRVHPLAISTATREMIQEGLTKLLDGPDQHLAAKSKAGFRKSMGPAVPAGFSKWSDMIQENWPMLKMGQTMEEVEKIIGPVRECPAMTEKYTKGATEGYTTSRYTLIFISGRLSRWELLP